MNKLNWNKERWRTRDRLLEYDVSIVPAHPHSAGLPYVYPWEDTSLSVMAHQLYLIAQQNGYDGTEPDFLTRFALGDEGKVVVGTLMTFPMPGDIDKLYLDEETGILYYFKETSEPISEAAAKAMGIIRIEPNDNITYLYIPVRALPIENLIYDCGDASDYIG